MKASRPTRYFAVGSLILACAVVATNTVTNAAAFADTPLVSTAVFNDPTGTPAQQSAIQDKLISLIDAAPTGSTVKMSMYYEDDADIANTLIQAHDRGVYTQVIFDSGEADPTSANAPVYTSLVTALGTTTSSALTSSWVYACPTERGCIGTLKLGSVPAINHNKFFLFTSTSGATNVVVQSSANLHDGRDGLRGWNNALILVGNPAIYTQYTGYFEDLRQHQANNNYYDTRTAVQSGNAKIFFYPRAATAGDDPYNDPGEDTIETILDNVTCKGNTYVGTADNHRTIIRVAATIFSRSYIADKLVALDAAGCYVEVATTYNPDSTGERASMQSLLAHTTSAYNGVNVWYYCYNNYHDVDTWIHSKYLQIEGGYYGKMDRSITWTGSANLSTNSLRQADETMLQFEDTPATPGVAPAGSVFDLYRSNFTSIRTSPTIFSTTNGGIAACPALQWNMSTAAGDATPTVHDLAPGTNNGTLTGGASLVAGVHASTDPSDLALATDGVSGYASSSHTAVLANTSFSVSAWVKLGATSTTWPCIVSQDGRYDGAYLLHYDGPDNKWAFAMTTADVASGASAPNVYSTGAAAVGVWTHLVGVYDAVGNTMSLYVNGHLQNSATAAGGFTVSGNVQVGRALYDSVYKYYFNGLIDQVHVYNEALTSTEVSALYAQA